MKYNFSILCVKDGLRNYNVWWYWNKKSKFHHRRNLILLEYVDIHDMQVSSMVSSGENNCKYFIGYKDDD